jgi:hypothetical protein
MVKEGSTTTKKCHLISILNFCGLLGNPSAIVCTCKVFGMHQQVVVGRIRGVGVKLVSLGT